MDGCSLLESAGHAAGVRFASFLGGGEDGRLVLGDLTDRTSRAGVNIDMDVDAVGASWMPRVHVGERQYQEEKETGNSGMAARGR